MRGDRVHLLNKELMAHLRTARKMRRAACTQAIASKSYRNLSLAILFNDRGIAYQNKGDLDRATTDYSEASSSTRTRQTLDRPRPCAFARGIGCAVAQDSDGSPARPLPSH
jgi:hypothetical protein